MSMRLPKNLERQILQQSITPSLMAPFPLDGSEDSWTDYLIAMGNSLGWKVVHFPRVRTNYKGKTRWETVYRGDGKGWLDMVFWRERVIYAELKEENGKPTPDQIIVMQELKVAGQEVYCWKPSDLESIRRILQ